MINSLGRVVCGFHSNEYADTSIWPITADASLVTWGNGTFVPHIVLMHGCNGRIPAPEWGFGGSLLLFAGDLGRVCQAVVGHECPTHTVHRMENALGNSLVALSSSRKFSARAALVDLQEPSRALLSECFRQFGIESISMTSDKAGRLASEKFEACVIRVGNHAAPVLESARKSRSNSRMIIYGLGGSLKEAMKLSEFGINAVFNEPLERPAALKLVRATQMLVLHEFRRYVRIPVITEVSIVAGKERHLTASSHELSSGGMSLKSSEDLAPGLPVEVSFALLTLPRIWVRGTISWTKPASKMLGIRFDPLDDRRFKIKEWVDSYLES